MPFIYATKHIRVKVYYAGAPDIGSSEAEESTDYWINSSKQVPKLGLREAETAKAKSDALASPCSLHFKDGSFISF
jgi:hypothetical protein